MTWEQPENEMFQTVERKKNLIHSNAIKEEKNGKQLKGRRDDKRKIQTKIK